MIFTEHLMFLEMHHDSKFKVCVTFFLPSDFRHFQKEASKYQKWETQVPGIPHHYEVSICGIQCEISDLSNLSPSTDLIQMQFSCFTRLYLNFHSYFMKRNGLTCNE